MGRLLYLIYVPTTLCTLFIGVFLGLPKFLSVAAQRDDKRYSKYVHTYVLPKDCKEEIQNRPFLSNFHKKSKEIYLTSKIITMLMRKKFDMLV